MQCMDVWVGAARLGGCSTNVATISFTSSPMGDNQEIDSSSTPSTGAHQIRLVQLT